MTENSDNITGHHAHLKRLEKLSLDRKRILSLPGHKALDEILDHPNPNALVHSFAEEDLYFLIHDIGSEDSLELLSLASNRQWEYILDIENWEKDTIKIDAVTHWLNLLQHADPRRFIVWAASEKSDLLEYYLSKSIEIRMREHDEDPSDFPDGFQTFDDILYFKFLDHTPELQAPELPENKESLKIKKVLLQKLLPDLADFNHVYFQEVLLRSSNVIPAESEEEAFRLRNFRLAEKGFLPFDEAVGIYQPISKDYLKKQQKIIIESSDDDAIMPVPINHISMMDEASFFSRALAMISADDLLQKLQVEFAGVCNQVVAADQSTAHDRDELKNIVKKAGGYISIGLEYLAADDNFNEENDLSNRIDVYIKSYPLIDLFRTGYGLATNLRQQARQWQKNGWFTKNKLSLSFWDETFVGVLGGLLINRPKFYDNYKSGELYREFESLKDIELTQNVLKEAMEYDNLLARMAISTGDFPEEKFITYKNLLLTLWARNRLGLSSQIVPISIKKFKPFFEGLWDVKTKPPVIKESKKSDFLLWIASVTEVPENKISQDLGQSLEILFDEIADNYGPVTADELDPRHILMFLLDA